jgi:hypothetical protein
MKKVHVWVEFPDDTYSAYRREAKLQSVTVARLVERTLNILLREEEQKARDGTDHQIVIS